jgi:secretion/DNA translocation related CpaE-like protein
LVSRYRPATVVSVPTILSLSRPLAITADSDLLDELVRLAEAGAVALEVAPDPAAARPRYGSAPLVLVGLDAALACCRAQLPQRPGVLLVGRSDAGQPVPWELAEALGAAQIAMLPTAESWLLERFAQLGDRSGQGRVLAVIGGRGGAGASVLAAGLAVTAVRTGLRTLLVDADPLGGGIDLVLGWEKVKGLRWPALREASGRVNPPALVDALPRQGELVVLSWDRGELVGLPTDAMAAAVDAGRRGRDLVVVDLPRSLDDAAALALGAADRALLVVPAELRAAAAAARVAKVAAVHCAALALVVRGPAPGRLRPKAIAQSLGLPLAGTLRPEPSLAGGLERGVIPAGSGRGPLAALCRRLVDDLLAARTESAA